MLYLLTLWFFVQLISLVCYPFSARIFSSLPDRGYSLNKSFALILFAALVWFAVSLRLLPFTRVTILVVGLVIALASLLVHFTRHKEKHPPPEKFRHYFLVEMIFFSLLLFFAYLKYRTPAIAGTEKPMDFALINGIFRSRFFPPNDAWYANASINYYYYGHYLIAFISKLTAIPTRIIYNLALPLVFALTGLNIFGLIRPYLFALLGIFLVLFAGNFDTAIQVIKAIWTSSAPVISWWNPSRIIGRGFFGDPNGYLTITEFPFFSLLLGDVHAHVLALVFGSLFLGICFAYFKKPTTSILISGSLVLAGLTMTNPWEVPGYLIITLLLLIFTQRNRLRLGFIGIISLVIFSLPFLAHYQMITPANDPKPFLNIIRSVTEIGRRTQLSEFVTIWATQLLFILIGLVVALRKRVLCRTLFIPSLTISFIVGYSFNSAVIFLLGILLSTLLCCLAKRTLIGKHNLFPFLLVTSGIIYLLFCELFFINDLFTPPLERMNTVFKFYYFAWTTLGVGSVLLLSNYFKFVIKNKLVLMPLFLFLAGNFAYFSLATPVRLAEFSKSAASLDGLKYLSSGTAANQADLSAIEWLNQRVVDQVNIVESAADPSGSTSYNSIGRISAATGLPTILGWSNGHEDGLWRKGGLEITGRSNDVRTIYESSNLQLVKSLLQKYAIKYIVVGQQEKLAYPRGDSQKFNQLGKSVFISGPTEIYQVL